MKWLVLLGMVIASSIAMPSPNVAFAQTQPRFVLGFKTLADMIPKVVGKPLESEHFDPLRGDALQKTTRGLLVWRKIDNWSAFTDGSTTWINGPHGLQERPNGQRFPWESQSTEAAAPSIRCGPPGPDYYEPCLFTDQYGGSMNFFLYVPPSVDPNQLYPLVLVLHGGGERPKPGMTPAEGDALLEGASYVRCWVGGATHLGEASVQSRWPSYVVVPQLDGNSKWVDVPPWHGSYHLAPQPTSELRMAKEIVDFLQQKFTNVDPNRLYIAGVSLGGYGTWDAIERWPGYFAAAVPVSGAGDPSRANELKDMPIWAFHGADDQTVPVSGSRGMIGAIRAAGGKPRYTEYPDGKHVIWVTAFNVDVPSADNIFQWLFAQRKPGPDQP